MKLIILLFISLGLVSCAGLQPRYHEIVPGENLSKIASRYRVSVGSLKQYNEDVVSTGLRPGAKLYIPFESRADWDRPVASEDIDIAGSGTQGPSPDVSPQDSPHFSWPLLGATVTSYFGIRHHRRHEGIDIGARQGTPVRSARSGHVIYAGNKIRGYGNMVIVKHADDYSTVYAHLSRFAPRMKKGDFVSRGEVVGFVGHTGHAFGSHLHFEVRFKREPKDPLFFLQARYARNTLGR